MEVGLPPNRSLRIPVEDFFVKAKRTLGNATINGFNALIPEDYREARRLFKPFKWIRRWNDHGHLLLGNETHLVAVVSKGESAYQRWSRQLRIRY
jgi:hypothetical protein